MVNCYQITDEPKLAHCEYGFALESIRQKNVRVWIDLRDHEDSELTNILDDLNIQGPIRQYCLELQNHPGFYPMKTAELLVIPVQTKEHDPNSMQYLALLCSPDFLLSFRHSKFDRMQKNINLEVSASCLADKSIAGLVSSIMIRLSLDSLSETAKLRDKIIILEEKMNRKPKSVEYENLTIQQSELYTLESIVHGQLPILAALTSTDRTTINAENTREYLIWAIANLKSADRTLEWLERRIDVIRSFVDSHGQDKTNSRLGRLTILSTIFMPATLLAGIWGMNFEFMPGLSFKYGYLVALSTMGIIVFGMYFYFRKRGWFN